MLLNYHNRFIKINNIYKRGGLTSIYYEIIFLFLIQKDARNVYIYIF